MSVQFESSNFKKFPHQLQFKDYAEFIGHISNVEKFQSKQSDFQVVKFRNVQAIQGINQLPIPYAVYVPYSALSQYEYGLYDFVELHGNPLFYESKNHTFIFLNRLYSFEVIYTAAELRRQQTVSF